MNIERQIESLVEALESGADFSEVEKSWRKLVRSKKRASAESSGGKHNDVVLQTVFELCGGR